MIKPVVNFLRLLFFLIVGLTLCGHAAAVPVWQSTSKKTVTPDPYFNPRFNDNEQKSIDKVASHIGAYHSDTSNIALQNGQQTALNASESTKLKTQPFWEPPRTPVVGKGNANNLSAGSATPMSNAQLSDYQPKSVASVSAGSKPSPKTIIREKNDFASDIVSNDFAASIVGRSPNKQSSPLQPAKSASLAANTGDFSAGKLDAPPSTPVNPTGQLLAKTDLGSTVSSNKISTTKTATAIKNNSLPVNVKTFEPTRLLAMVGGEPIFVGDLLFEVNQMIERFMGNAPEKFKAQERRKIVKRILPKFVDAKILYLGTLDLLPDGADVNSILEQAGKEFDEKALPRMMESAGLKTANEFDAQLRAQGSSLRKMRLAWSQDQLTKYFLSQQLQADSEVTHQEMLDNYRSSIEDYAVPARAKWEQVMIRFDRAGSRTEAKKQISELANQIVYGANLAAIAKKSSHGFRATEGGQHDWTSKGALVLSEIDEAIFTLPVGELSDVIESPDGYHVVRVLERTESTHTPFLEAQVKIKEQLLEERRQTAFKSHLEELRDRIPVEYFDMNDQNMPQTEAALPASGDKIR